MKMEEEEEEEKEKVKEEEKGGGKRKKDSRAFLRSSLSFNHTYDTGLKMGTKSLKDILES